MAKNARRTDPSARRDQVAVVGIGCRLPDARDHREFFQNLCEDRCSIREITPDRWDPALFYSPDPAAPNRSISKWCGLIDDPFGFDPAFFKISPREVKVMDPQQRLLLEETWHCIEDAAIPLRELRAARTSVFLGAMNRDYLQRLSDPSAAVESHSFFGSSDFMMANRISHAFDLRGQSLVVDGACAASLIAIHHAIEALVLGEADFALAGGVHLELHPWRSISLSKARMLSPEGLCRTFDKDADGFVPGEGAAMLLLRRLEEAERDGDHIYGVLRGSAVNHGGRRLTISAPTVESQRDVIAAALARAGVGPETIDYVEAHGTGTSLGDPIEVEALTAAFRQGTRERQYCWIGAVKTNIGHLCAAAGVAGVIKVLLMMVERKIPASLHVRTPNPLIDFAGSPFKIAGRLEDWRRRDDRRPYRAGVSSFGAGGGNSHLIIEEHRPPKAARREETAGPHLFLLSARTPDDLQALIGRWRLFIDRVGLSDDALADVSYTLATGREPFAHRVGGFVRTADDVRAFLGGARDTGARRAPTPGDAGGWLLRVGDVALPPRREMQQFLAAPPIARVLADLEGTAAGTGGRAPRLRGGKGGPAERCLFAYLLARVVMDLGLEPAAVSTTGEGLWAGLAIAGMLDWRAAAARAEGRGAATPDLPAIPFLDPVTGETIHGERLDAAYFTGLLADLDVAADVAAPLFTKAWLLAGSQPTFRSNLEEWNELLRGRGLERWTLSSDAEITFRPDEDRRKTLVRTVAIRNALDRLHRKWRLSGVATPGHPRLEELLALLLDGVLTSDGAIALLLGNEEERAHAMEAAGTRSHLVDRSKPDRPPREHARRAGGRRFDQGWLDRAATAAASDAIVNDHRAGASAVLQLGAGVSRATAHTAVILDGADDWCGAMAGALMTLWLAGVDVRWDRWFAGRGLRRVSAPTYEFARRERFAIAPPRAAWGRDERPDHAAPAAVLVRLWPRWSPAGTPAADEEIEHTDPVLVLAGSDRQAASAGRLFGRRATIVRLGTEYRDASDETFAIRAEEEGDYDRLLSTLERRGLVPHRVVHAWSLDADEDVCLERRLSAGPYSLFLLTRALLRRQPGERRRILFVHLHERGAVRPEQAAVAGLARSVRREAPGVAIRAVALDRAARDVDWWRLVERELRTGDGVPAVRYDGPRRLVHAYASTCDAAERTDARTIGQGPGIRPGAVVLITGGAGGIGLALARHLLRVPDVRVALAGRSAASAVRERLADAARTDAARLAYFQADVARREDAHAVVRLVRERFGPLTSVIHAAGTRRDSFVLRKTLDDLKAVAAPKVSGVVHLDDATKDEPLEHFVLFSSLAAAAGNIGQADYAFANAFLDAFAIERERRRTAGARAGRTLSIGWPLWAAGGMTVGGHADSIADQGLVPMPTSDGLAAFDAALQGPAGHHVVLYGDPARSVRLLDAGPEDAWTPASRAAPRPAAPGAPTPGSPLGPGAATGSLTTIAERYLSGVLAELLDVPSSEIHLDAGLEEHGIDSILIGQFNVRIERDLGKVSKTVLYEYRTLAGVAAALAARRPAELTALQAVHVPAAEPIAPLAGAPPLSGSSRPSPVREGRGDGEDDGDDGEDGGDGVAIIGMSGRYPMAPDLDRFWSNLAAGRDCVTGIPVARWGGANGHGPAAPYCRWGAFLDDIDRFDPLFFSISPRDAELIDPQERLFLEVAWEAFEDAGYPPVRLGEAEERRVGVFVGVTTQSYLLWGPDEWRKGNRVIPTSTPWTIANRVSYWLDLHGPSMPVDTACAASLTAAHLACESLRRGECRMALVGGVNLYLHPSKYDWLCQLQMLSATGRCRTFGDGADGFVPGEGVGALLLKPLRAAAADGDRILGVIRGSAVNHGGRTSGFMVPSPNAQAALVRAALAQARVDPRTIGYVEAHGTGTALGDPIEIAGLTRAFAAAPIGAAPSTAWTEPHPADLPPAGSIAIGSVKSNIGHLESAAGLAGLTKILLQMEHGQLVPTLHAERTNPRIPFAESPFRVQRTLSDWPRPTSTERARGRRVPRRAGISAFGAGGSNAHLIVEQYDGPQTSRRGVPAGEQVIVLSAKTEERLRAHCARLAAWLRASGGERPLSEIAYQLQVRREPLEERLAVIAEDPRELAARLERFAVAGDVGARAWRGAVRTVRSAPNGFRAPDRAAVGDAPARRDADTLAAGWVAGADTSWDALHDGPLRPVRLPSYPFADERYWLPIADEPAVSALAPRSAPSDAPALASPNALRHPFLGQRDAGAASPRFSIDFSGDEFFLADHLVDRARILPAVAYLEMALAAAEAAGDACVRRVRKTVFTAPIDVAAPRRVHIQLVPEPSGNDCQVAAFEVYSLAPRGDRISHGQGRLETAAAGGGQGRPAGGSIDLDAIRARCAGRLSAAELYPRLAGLGLALGPSYQGIQRVSVGLAEVLSEIRIPDHLRAGLASFTLHPSLLDSALQACQVLFEPRGAERRLYVPFTFGDVDIFGPTPAHGFSHVVLTATSDSAKKLDVSLTDEQGRVAVRIRDFWVRPWRRAEEPAGSAMASSAASASTDAIAPAASGAGVFFRPFWAEDPVGDPDPVRSDTLLVLARSVEHGRWLATAIERRTSQPYRRALIATPAFSFRLAADDHCEVAPNDPAGVEALAALTASGGERLDLVYAWPHGAFTGGSLVLDEQLAAGATPLFRLIRELLGSHRAARIRWLTIIPQGADDSGGEQPCYRALGGFLRAAARESARLTHRQLELPIASRMEADAAIADVIATELLARWGREDDVRRRGGVRTVRRWADWRADHAGASHPALRRRGVYLLVGGAGGVGRHVARYLAAEVGARLVLAGRTAPNDATAALCREISEAGGDARYVSCDISRAEQATTLPATVRATYGALHGIVHCAGIQRDRLVLAGGAEDVGAHLDAKVRGALHLDAATRDEALDFVVLFSSMAGVVGSVGQAAYAYANAFLDAFADWREALRRAGRRSGRTLAIDWPLWREGGMHVDAATEEALRATFGMRPMDTPTALAALATALASAPGGSLVYAAEDTETLRRVLRAERADGSASTRPADAPPIPSSRPTMDQPPLTDAIADEAQIRRRLDAVLADSVGEIQKIDPARIERERRLADYGFDSIAFTRLANRINDAAGSDLTPATFFEHPTLAAVAAHLLEEAGPALAARLGRRDQPETTVAPPVPPTIPETLSVPAEATPVWPVTSPLLSSPPVSSTESAPPAREPIAIVGMHGLLPRSEDLDEFWDHLEHGRDLVTEIPSDRWDWREYYGDPLTGRNKTNSKWGAFLREVDTFDARFFGISPREAMLMDPRQRLFLETVYKAIEEAGYRPSELSRRRTGLFVGVSGLDYYELLKDADVPVEAYTTTGMLHGMLPNRVSYLLDLTGPSFPIDTACSSSLVALRAALEAMWAGSCDAAIAGGVNLLLAPMIYISFSRAGMMSPDGRCKTFDESANGYVRGEGAGALVLKRLSDAVRDGDHIHALIRGSAVNHGGRVNTLTTPSPNAQSALIVDAFEQGRIDPGTVGYIEVHGTGTALGDPIEINGLKKAFGELRRRAGQPPLTDGRCRIGSVKTNIGHLEAAAGVAGLFKAILAMKHGRIPASLHLKTLNPYIRLDDSPFRIVRAIEPWPRARDAEGREQPRRAGVSSFGFGGVNAHVLLEEYVAPPTIDAAAGPDRTEHLFVLSAADGERLAARARDLIVHLSRLAPASAQTPPQRRIEGELIALASELLGVPASEIPPDERLEDLAFDRIRRRQLADRIADVYGVTGAITAAGSLRAIARAVASALGPSAVTADRADRTDRADVEPPPAVRLTDLAYTLQVGREPMERRAAVLASSIADLLAKLDAVAANGADLSGINDTWIGSSARRQAAADVEPIDALIARRDLRGLAARWLAGDPVEWPRLYAVTPRRLSLPTYPFAKTRFWIPAAAAAPTTSERTIHPLIDGIAAHGSLGDGLVFRKRLTPSDRIVAEHTLRGVGILPGVAHLEMARAAIASVHDGPLRLVAVVWQRPLAIEAPGGDVRVRLRRAGQRIAWAVETGDGDGPAVVCSQGECELLRGPLDDSPESDGAPSSDSLEDIRRRCPTRREARDHYQRFAAMGIAYGPYFQGVREVWIGDAEALAHVAVGPSDRAALSAFVLHPTLADAALQTIAALDVLDAAASPRARLPFAVDAVEMLRPLTAEGFVHAREVARDRFDVRVLDGSGLPCVVLRGVVVRPDRDPRPDPWQGALFVPRWQPAPRVRDERPAAIEAIDSSRGAGACLIVHPPGDFGLASALAARQRDVEVPRLVLGREHRRLAERVWEIDVNDAAALAAHVRGFTRVGTVFFLGGLLERSADPNVAAAATALQERGALSLFRLVHALDAADRIQELRALTVLVNDVHDIGGRRPGNAGAAGLLGLSKSLAKEYPHVAIRCLDVGVSVGSMLREDERASVIDAVLAEPVHRQGEEVTLHRGRRWIRRLMPVRLARPDRPPFRRHGVYMIVGGASGIGARLAEHLAEVAGARLALIGRRPERTETVRLIEAIAARGGEAIYLQADVTDRTAMAGALAHVKQRFGALHGVMHGALVLRDRLIARQDEDTFRAVLAPKVEGTAVLADVLRMERLDFLLLVSSVQSFAGSAGQGNYAAASTFLDGFGRALAGEMPFPVKIVNWGFWGTVGSVASPEYRERLGARGVQSIAPDDGMDAVERVIAGDERQVIAIRATMEALAGIGVDAARTAAAPSDRDEPDLDATAATLLSSIPRLEIAAQDDDERDELETYIAHALLERFRDLGVFRTAGERRRRDALVHQIGGGPLDGRLIDALVRVLVRHRFVVDATDALVSTDAVAREDLARALADLPQRSEALRARFPRLTARLDLLDQCLLHLPEVLAGRLSGTEVLFPGGSLDLVAGVYRGNRLGAYCNELCAQAVRAVLTSRREPSGAATPELRILEVGAGTGGTTRGVLDALRELDLQVRYDFTDLSPQFLREGERTFGTAWSGLRFRLLDIERPVEVQGFEAGAYDLVLAAGVLHATADLDTTLLHVRRGLAPGGWLILNEPTRFDEFYTITFGLLEGWWRHREAARRLPDSPLLDVEMWRSRLHDAGFTAIAVLGSAGDGRELDQRVLVARSSVVRAGTIAGADARPAGPVVARPGAAADRAVIRSGGATAIMTRIPDPGHLSSRGAARPDVSLGERLTTLMAQVTAECLGMPPSDVALDRELSSFGVDSIVGVELINRLNQRLGIVLKTIVVFDYPTIRALVEHVLDRHGDAVAAALRPAPPAAAAASTPRPGPPPPDRQPGPDPVRVDAFAAPVRVPPAAPPQIVRGARTFRAVRFERPGSPRDLAIAPIEPVTPGPGEVEVEVRAFPINFSDFLLAKGLYPMMPDYPFTPGVEAAGVVRRIGPGVTRVAAGDEVMALARPEMGAQASLLLTDDAFVVEKPVRVSFEDACGFAVPFIAMFMAFERANVRPGERVLIQAATGANGLIAVQLARNAGAEIFATAGSPRKIRHLEGMGVTHAIDYRATDFGTEVLRRTSGRGVDVIIDTVGGEMLQKGLNILAPEGRYVEFAVFGLQASHDVSLSRLVENQVFYSINAKKHFVRHPEDRARYMDLMAAHLERGSVQPFTAAVFPFERVAEAYAAKEDREGIGRIVVSLAAADPASAADAIPPPVASDAGFAAAPSASPPPRPGAGQPMDMAVIGMSGRFPGAEDLAALWENLAAGVSAVRDVPASRWANDRYYDPDPTRLDRTSCRTGGFVDHVDRFDASFFEISGKEAAQTDPQQRLFLEEAYRALEDAGYPSRALAGTRCGVFVGAGGSDYLTRMNAAGVLKEAQAFWGNDTSVLASRIAYFLDLKGPSVTVNTACSSSLVSIHLACQSILTGDSDLALAGGVFLSLAPDYFIVATNGHMMAPDGRCKTFDDGADGYGPGEGVGVLVLKPLARAREDGDYVHGVIKATAINQDGKTNGITAPSSLAQTQVELAAYERFGIDPATLGVVEAHGTGTRLGDPIEVEALSRAFRTVTDETRFCAIGSIKTNIGHAATAAGVAGVIKVLLALRHRRIPPSLNYRRPNRYIDFDNSPFFVNTELRDWAPRKGAPRRAAVSSFGFSGTNAHAVIEEAPPRPASDLHPQEEYLIPLSAASPAALQRRIAQLARWLPRDGATYALADISDNLQRRRDHFRHRLALVVRDRDELARALREASADGGPRPGTPTGPPTTGSVAAAAAAYGAGETVDWSTLWAGGRGVRIPLPTYPFDPERHWYVDEGKDTVYGGAVRVTPITFRPSGSTNGSGERHLRLTLTGDEFYLTGHRVGGEKILPGALYVELACRAAEAAGVAAGAIRDLFWLRPLSVKGGPVDLDMTLHRSDRRLRFELRSLPAGGRPVVHAQGAVIEPEARPRPIPLDLDRIVHACPRIVARDELYGRLRAKGLVHADVLAAVDSVRVGEGRVLGRLRLPDEGRESLGAFLLHPSVLDGAFQLLAAFDDGTARDRERRLLPFSVREVSLSGQLPAECHAYVEEVGDRSAPVRTFQILIVDDEGRERVGFRDFSTKAAASSRAAANGDTPAAGPADDLLTLLRRFEAGVIDEDAAARAMEVILEQ